MKQTRNLEDLLRQYDLLAAPAARDAAVTGICNDSRRAKDGDLFICKGYGFKPEYLAMARRQGAVCALAETDFPGVDIPCIRVTDVRKAQSLAARWFYDNPSDGLTLIGVTGTKGKTTTSYMIQAVTNALAGRTMGLSSSAGRYCGGPDVDTHLTTPESLDLQWLFAQARDHGLPYMTAEVSSQAYQVERVYGEHFDIGVFLNFSEDHISPKEHASMEEYLQCKLQLLENSGRAVICRETAQFDRVYDTARRCCRAVMLVGMDRDDCDLTVRQVEKLTHGFRFFVQERGSEALHPYHLAMDGDFNIENALAAIGVGRLLGAEHEQMAAALDALEVPGRMNRYEGGGVHVLVDCMHNRASSQALLTDLKRDYPARPSPWSPASPEAAPPSGSRAWARCAANTPTGSSSPPITRISTIPPTSRPSGPCGGPGRPRPGHHPVRPHPGGGAGHSGGPGGGGDRPGRKGQRRHPADPGRIRPL